MIYILDDKEERQTNLGWSMSKFGVFASFLKVYHSYAEIHGNQEEILKSGNLLLFHESFFDAPQNKKEDLSNNFRNDLSNYAEKQNLYLVYFSGSIGARRILDKVAYCPVGALYSNLQYYLNYWKLGEEHSLKRLLFGHLYLLEEVLLVKKEIWKLVYDENQRSQYIASSALEDRLEQLGALISFDLNQKYVDFTHMKYYINYCVNEKLFNS